MTHTKKAFIVTAIALVALGGATLPATADNHMPAPPRSLAIQDNHAPVIPLNSHTPVSPLDNHMP